MAAERHGIEAEGLVRTFKGDITAVDGIDLRVESGEISRTRCLERVPDDVVGRAGRRDVVPHRQFESREVLEHGRETAPPLGEVQFA